MKIDLYCDLDGVLVDFERGIMEEFGLSYPKTMIPKEEFEAFSSDLYGKITNMGPRFWTRLAPLPDAMELFEFIKEYDPSILSAYPHTISDPKDKLGVFEGKHAWVMGHLGICSYRKFNVCYAKDKYQFVNPKKKSILIDDRAGNIDDWIQVGGIGILHTSAKTTIEQLKKVI